LPSLRPTLLPYTTLFRSFHSYGGNGRQKLHHHKYGEESQENQRPHFLFRPEDFPVGTGFSFPQEVETYTHQNPRNTGDAGGADTFHKGGFGLGGRLQIRKLKEKSHTLKNCKE